jgi:hypothetical protein
MHNILVFNNVVIVKVCTVIQFLQFDVVRIIKVFYYYHYYY